jgi:hypothetical protein
VDAAVDDPGAALAGHAADLVAAQGVAGVDADADDVAGLDAFGDDLLEGFVDQDGVAGGAGVAAARTKSHRGVMTAVPKELSLGLMRWTRKLFHVEQFRANGNRLGRVCCKWLCFVTHPVA